MARWFRALKASLYSLFMAEPIIEERPEEADPTQHDDMQCRHCGHVHAEADGSCACGCTLLGT